MPDVATPPYHPLYCGGRRIHGGSDVEVENWFAGRFWIGGIVVDHVADLLCCAGRCPACDVPVVAVEGGFGAVEEVVYLSTRSTR